MKSTLREFVLEVVTTVIGIYIFGWLIDDVHPWVKKKWRKWKSVR